MLVAHLPAKLAAKVTGWSAHQASCSPAIPALCGLDQDLPLELDLAAGVFFSSHGIPPADSVFCKVYFSAQPNNLRLILKNTILLNIYLSQLVRVRGKYTFLSFSDFQTLDP